MRSVVQLLLLDGFDVHCSQFGNEGLSLARSGQFAAAILDFHLPDIAGITVLNELRKTGHRLPVIVVTGRYIQTDHEHVALALGAARFLPKPLDAEQLALAVRLAVSDRTVTAHSQARHHTDPPTLYRGSRSLVPAADSSHHVQHLHSGALRGDRRAIEQLAQELLPSVIASLRRRWTHVEPEWINDAAVDAFLEYSGRPERFDPSRGVPLTLYIRYAARRNLLNRIDSETRRSRRETTLEAVDTFRLPTPSVTWLSTHLNQLTSLHL